MISKTTELEHYRSLNELAELLHEEGYSKEATRLEKISNSLDKSKEQTDPQKVKTAGFYNRLKRVVEGLK